MFAERLKELRIAAGLKQEELATILGTTPNAISNMRQASVGLVMKLLLLLRTISMFPLTTYWGEHMFVSLLIL